MALHETGNVLLPRVVPGKKDVAVAGSGVIKDWRLVGWLDEVETRSVGLILGQVTGGTIDIIGYPTKDKRVTLEILNAKKQLQPYVNGDDINASIKIAIDARISESDVRQKVADEKYIRNVEAIASQHVTRQIEQTVRKLQQEFQADVIGLGWLIQKEMPKDWLRLGHDWTTAFIQATITVEVDIHIREIGMVG